MSRQQRVLTDYYPVRTLQRKANSRRRYKDTTRSTRIADYFSVVRRKRYYCLRCRKKFESQFHESVHRCPGVCRDQESAPRVRFQDLHDEIVLQIVKRLDDCDDLASLTIALPRVVDIHGISKQWTSLYRSFQRGADRYMIDNDGWLRSWYGRAEFAIERLTRRRYKVDILIQVSTIIRKRDEDRLLLDDDV